MSGARRAWRIIVDEWGLSEYDTDVAHMLNVMFVTVGARRGTLIEDTFEPGDVRRLVSVLRRAGFPLGASVLAGNSPATLVVNTRQVNANQRNSARRNYVALGRVLGYACAGELYSQRRRTAYTLTAHAADLTRLVGSSDGISFYTEVCENKDDEDGASRAQLAAIRKTAQRCGDALRTIFGDDARVKLEHHAMPYVGDNDN